ncbi:MAG: M81 family metallopeptidase [Henriciella sp.]|nr:M81 family metallopeptidase [Henriciella sp.]
MKVFIAGLATETNTFSPIPTGMISYQEGLIAHGDATTRAPVGFGAPMHVWRDRAEALGWDVAESLAAFAQPAGPTVASVYNAFVDEILTDLKAAKPVDIILLTMHGAMVAENCDDCEGDLMSRCREIVGPDAIIGLEIDPHCHMTPLMLEAANLIVAYKEYPHTDISDRAEDLFTLAADAATGKTNPIMRTYDCHMIGMYFTPLEPIRSFTDDMFAEEGKGGILSLSLCHGFPWGDTAETGTKMLAIADGDAAIAAARARAYGERLWSLRDQLVSNYPTIEEALDKAEALDADKPIVLGDFADNAGGGAPSDSTFVLKEVLNRGLKGVALGMYWDPIVIRQCVEAGEGARLTLRIGGKMGPASGNPIDLTVRVLAIKKGLKQKFGDLDMPMGTAALLEANGVYLLVNDQRSQLFDPSGFTQLGLDLSQMKIIVVKSSNHFYDRFAPIAEVVWHMKTPGAITPEFTSIPYTKRDGNYWPRVDDPFASETALAE